MEDDIHNYLSTDMFRGTLNSLWSERSVRESGCKLAKQP